MGPLAIYIARLDERKQYVLFGGGKYEEVVKDSISFAEQAVRYKEIIYGDEHGYFPGNRLSPLTEAYRKAMLSIANHLGVSKRSDLNEMLLRDL